MEKGICTFWAIIIGIAGLTVASIPGAVVGALAGYCLGAKITDYK